MRTKTIVALVVLAAGLAACRQGGKQEAAVALDEARLTVGQARKAGADPGKSQRMAEAENSLAIAEHSFKTGNFTKARATAEKAASAAAAARSDAAAASKGSKTAKRPKPKGR